MSESKESQRWRAGFVGCSIFAKVLSALIEVYPTCLRPSARNVVVESLCGGIGEATTTALLESHLSERCIISMLSAGRRTGYSFAELERFRIGRVVAVVLVAGEDVVLVGGGRATRNEDGR